jgi:hypothetical protein
MNQCLCRSCFENDFRLTASTWLGLQIYAATHSLSPREGPMRTMTAFYVAPLAVPLILGVYFENADLRREAP